MGKDEIIKLGTRLGLKFDPKRTYQDGLDRDYVVFDGNNSQRFSIDGKKLTDDEIYSEMGQFLIDMGKSIKAQEISQALKF
jgi:hypothetical protein